MRCIGLLFLLVGVCVASKSKDWVRDLHLVRHVTDMYTPPEKASWLFCLKFKDGTDWTQLGEWTYAAANSILASHSRYNITVLIHAHPNASFTQDLLDVGVTRVLYVSEYLATLPAKVADAYAALDGRTNEYSFYYGTWTKLLAWTMVEYEKVVALDVDAYVYQPADELFAYPELSAAPDILHPMNRGEHPLIFNAGLLVLEPNMEMFMKLSATASKFETPEAFTWEGGDQIFLNTFFAEQWHWLPISYNLWGGMLDAYYKWPYPNAEGIRVVHGIRMSAGMLPRWESDCEGSPDPNMYCTACCKDLVRHKNEALDRVELRRRERHEKHGDSLRSAHAEHERNGHKHVSRKEQ